MSKTTNRFSPECVLARCDWFSITRRSIHPAEAAIQSIAMELADFHDDWDLHA